MNLPERATIVISSPYPLSISAPCLMQVHALMSIHIRYDCKLTIPPAGPAMSGFVRDWLKLPNELKLQIFHHNLVFPSSIWPSHINTVTRREYFSYLRRTPDIATIARYVFYQENGFIMQFSFPAPNREFVLAIPPAMTRPQLRCVTFLTRLTAFDGLIPQAMSGEPCAGLTGLVHLEVTCMS